MFVMSLGIRGFNPIWTEFDLQGQIFDDTFYLFVLENTIPYIPATVYHDPDLNVPWTNPIQFLGNGTLPVDIYFEPDVVYRLEFRQGPTQADPLIYEVNNYVAGEGGSTPVDTVAFASSNQITNPQFSLINFESPITISATDPDPIEIGPGWFLEVAGSGSVTMTQVPLNNSNENPSNAPYALQLTLTGWTADSIFLRQRFQQNGMLWANKFVSSTLTARVEGTPRAVSAILVDSEGAPLATVLDVPAVNQQWNEFTGYGELPETTNTDTPPDAYIDYKLVIPNNIDLYVTSIQLVVQEIAIEPSFEQDTIERQVDHTFHYYKPLLEFKPIPSYLVGWDFPLNPSQFGPTAPTGAVALGAIGANKSAYVWDQTIAFQTANSAIASSRSTAGNLVITTSVSTRFAIIQYLDHKQVQKILINNLSVNTVLAASTAVNMTVSLWYTDNASLPVVTAGTNNSLVTGLDADGFPTVVSGWTQLARKNGQKATFAAPTSLATQEDATNGFSGWEALDKTTVATQLWFAIVVGTGTMPISSTVEFSSISLVPGDIPTIPAPQTADEVLRECQYYYEKSYDYNVHTATATAVGQRYSYNTTLFNAGLGNHDQLYLNSFALDYKQSKRLAPTVTFYGPDGTSAASGGSVSVGIYRNGAAVAAAGNPQNYSISSNYALQGNSEGRVCINCVTTTTLRKDFAGGNISDEGKILYHYEADARLGII